MLIKLLHSMSINNQGYSGVKGENRPLITQLNGRVKSSELFWYFNGIMFEKEKSPNDILQLHAQMKLLLREG